MNVAAYLHHNNPNNAMINPASRDLLAVALLLLRTSIPSIKDFHKPPRLPPMNCKGGRHPMKISRELNRECDLPGDRILNHRRGLRITDMINTCEEQKQ